MSELISFIIPDVQHDVIHVEQVVDCCSTSQSGPVSTVCDDLTDGLSVLLGIYAV